MYSPMYRLALSYTCLNLILVVFSFYFCPLKKIASVNTLLIAVATTQIFIFVSLPILIHYYQSLFPFLSKTGAMVLHVFIHYIPLLWVCTNFGFEDASIALLLFGVWYLSVRKNIKKIYSDKISIRKYDAIMFYSSLLFVVLINLCFS